MERISLDNFQLSKNSKCLIATPINHLPLVRDFILDKSQFFKVAEKINKYQLEKILQKDSSLKYLFVNPNAQGYFLDADLLNKIQIKGINTCSTGTNHIDLKYCEKNNISVISLTRDYNLINDLPSTSELAFTLLQGLFRKIILCNNKVIDEGIWDYTDVMGNQLAGKTIGCLGYGRLGKIFCQQLKGFNVHIKVCEKEKIVIPKTYEQVSLNELFETCDAVAIHIHSSDDNKNLISKDLLSNTKRGFVLINTSRGDICDELEICKYLKSGHLGGYGTDVLSSEFIDIDLSPIYNLAKQKKYNIIITPHVGGMTFEGQSKAFLYALNKFKFINN